MTLIILLLICRNHEDYSPKLNKQELSLFHDELIRFHFIGIKPIINVLQHPLFDEIGKKLQTNILYKVIRNNFPDLRSVPDKPMESKRMKFLIMILINIICT